MNWTISPHHGHSTSRFGHTCCTWCSKSTERASGPSCSISKPHSRLHGVRQPVSHSRIGPSYLYTLSLIRRNRAVHATTPVRTQNTRSNVHHNTRSNVHHNIRSTHSRTRSSARQYTAEKRRLPTAANVTGHSLCPISLLAGLPPCNGLHPSHSTTSLHSLRTIAALSNHVHKCRSARRPLECTLQ